MYNGIVHHNQNMEGIMESYKAIIESEIAGIPCKIGVLTYHVTKPWRGNPHDCPSDLDYYGYTDIEFDILKYNLKPFSWLEAKMTWREKEDIKRDIGDYFEAIEPDCDNYRDRYCY